jgi:hypothetical protein
MAITRVGASQATNNFSATSVNLTRSAGTIGNTVVASCYYSTRTNAGTISDTQGNTWTILNPDFNDAGNSTRMISWWASAKNTSSTVVTVASNGAAGFVGMTLEEFTGTDTVSPVDQVNHSVAGATGTPTSGAITLGVNDALVWALAIDNITAVGNIDGSAATKGSDDGSNDWSEFRVLSGRSGISVTAAFTGSGGYDVFIASFKPASAATFLAAKSKPILQAVTRASYW